MVREVHMRELSRDDESVVADEGAAGGADSLFAVGS